MKNYLCRVSYDGTNYYGWQYQPKKRTVQEEIEKALFKIYKKEIKITAAGRTDAKVHALGQHFNFKTEKELSLKAVKKALNSNLTASIRVLSVRRVSLRFNARFDAKERIYEYRFYTGDVLYPYERNYTAHYPRFKNLNLCRLREFFKVFEGEYNFKGFCGRGSYVKTYTRRINYIKVMKKGFYYKIKISGRSFLKHQIRLMTGAALYSSQKKISLNEIKKSLKTGDKLSKPFNASPCGLYLVNVKY